MNIKSKQAVIKKEIPLPEGMEGACLKGHTVLYINGMTELPKEFKEERDFIRDVISGETGESMTNTGAAIVNCSMHGTPLKGFKLQESGDGKFSTGFLYISGKYISVNVERYGTEVHVTVTKSTVKFYENVVETVWRYDGFLKDMSFPSQAERYKKAINAAIEKSMCYHCKCTHFY